MPRVDEPDPERDNEAETAREITVHELVGSRYFVELVERFYDGVVDDHLLSAIYPEDLTGPRERLAAFLVQYWGGPTTYSDERGHPRLRMRHMPFRVDEAARDAWLSHMLVAVAESSADETVKATISDYFVRSADFLRNSD